MGGRSATRSEACHLEHRGMTELAHLERGLSDKRPSLAPSAGQRDQVEGAETRSRQEDREELAANVRLIQARDES